MNTSGPHKQSRRWTWLSPGGDYHNQIDYITVKRRFQASLNIAKTMSFPGADIRSDHELVMMTFRLHLQRIYYSVLLCRKSKISIKKSTRTFSLNCSSLSAWSVGKCTKKWSQEVLLCTDCVSPQTRSRSLKAFNGANSISMTGMKKMWLKSLPVMSNVGDDWLARWTRLITIPS